MASELEKIELSSFKSGTARDLETTPDSGKTAITGY